MEEQITIEWNETARKGMRKTKQQLKKEGVEIRELKEKFKNKQRNGEDSWKDRSSLWKAKWNYRHKHIAYSELRGREKHQIEENRPLENRKLEENAIKF